MRVKIPFVLTAIIFVIFVLSAGCTGVQIPGIPGNAQDQGANNGNAGGNNAPSADPTADPTAEPTEEPTVEPTLPAGASVVMATPIQTEDANSLKYHIPPADAADDGYMTVYTESKLLSGITAFDYFLKTPPMIFTYDATVPVVTRTKTGTSEFGEKEEYTVNVTYPDPLSYYQIIVYDKDTSKVLAEYSVDPFNKVRDKGSFKYLSPGNLHVEISGAVATVTTEVKVPKSNLD